MIPPVRSHIAALKLNTRLFSNCLVGLSAEDARKRVGDANSVEFIATHLVDARHYIATMIGSQDPHPFSPAVQAARNIQEAGTLPPLPELERLWRSVSTRVIHHLEHVPDTVVAAPAAQQFPIDDKSILGGITFLVHHESYHIGQLAILRRQLGFEAMSYSDQ